MLAAAGVSNTGPTTVYGNIGSYSNPAIVPGASGFTFSGPGVLEPATPVAQQAQEDLLVGYNAAAGAASTETLASAELNRGTSYMPGVYTLATSAGLTGQMTLDGGGRKDGVFVFQIGSTLTTASDSSVLFTNGAQPCNVYWQIGSSATFGTGTDFVGNVLARVDITATTGATFEGRLLADTGAITLDTNTITNPGCDTSGGGDATGGDTAADDPTGDDATGGDTTGGDTAGGDTAGGDTAGGDTAAGEGTTGIESLTGVEAGSDASDLTDADLPDTGGPTGILVIYGLLAVAGGYTLLRLRPMPGKHRG